MAGLSLGDVIVKLKADSSQFNVGVAQAESKISRFGGGVKSAVGKAGRALLFLGKAAVVAGVATAALVGGMIIKGGISRALNIEEAQAKLRGLGHNAKSVTKIMDNALASVKGTAFGLDAAATTAAGAVAAGIKPGKELEGVLKTVANSAALAGVDMGEMGAIFNKVATSNKAQMDVINQLGDKGIPVLQFLAKELGVTAEKAAEMASAGEINFAIFERAMKKGVGNAADEMGKTTIGAWKNMQAAMSRVGAAIVEDAIPKVREAFKSITAWFDSNSDKIVSYATMIADGVSKAFGAIANFVRTNWPTIKSAFNTLKTTLQNLWQVFKGLPAPIQAFLSPMGFLLLHFKEVWRVVKELANIFMVWFWPSIKALASTIWNQLLPSLKSVWESVVRLWHALNPALMTALKWIGIIIGVVLIGAIWLLINALNIVAKAIGLVAKIIAVAVGWLANLIGWIGTAVMAVINFGVKSVKAFYGILSAAQFVVRRILEFIGNFLSRSVAAFRALRDAGEQAFRRIVSAVAGAIGKVIGFVAGLPGRLLGAIGSLGSLLYSAGSDLLQGLINGVKSKVGAVVDAVKGAVESAVSGVKGFLGIESPSKLFAEIGENMAAGMSVGVSSGSKSVNRAVAGLGAGAASTAVTNTATTNINGPINVSNPQDADYLMKRINRSQELAGMGLASG